MSVEKMVFQIKDFERSYFPMSHEKMTYTSLAILAISQGDASTLRELVEKLDVKKVFLQKVLELGMSQQAQRKLSLYVEETIKGISYGELIDYVVLHAKALELYSTTELAEAIIKIATQSSKSIISVPEQVTNIVSMYFGDVSGSTIHTFSSGLGVETIDLYKKYPTSQLAVQQLTIDSGLIIELYFCIQKETLDIRYGDVISQPLYTEGNQLQRFDYLYMLPPFGAKATTEQEHTIESDKYARFDYFGKPAKSHLDLGYVVSGLSALSDKGKAAFLLPIGALFRSGMDQKIRERLLYSDVIEAIIELPGGLLAPYTGISTALVLVNKNKANDRENKIMLINVGNYGEGDRRNLKLSNRAMEIIENGLYELKEKSAVASVMNNSEFKDMNLVPSNYLYEAEMEFDDLGTVQFDLTAFDQLNTQPLKRLASIYRGYNALPRNLDEKGPYAVLKIADIENGEIDYEGLTYYNVEERTKVDNYRIRKGDLILSIRGQSLKIAVFGQDRDDVLLSQNFVGIRCSNKLDSQFLKLYFESPTVQFIFHSKLTGSTVMNLPIKEVEGLRVPLLTLEKQREIVTKYQEQLRQIQLELTALQEHLKNAKLASYEAMGMGDTYKLNEK